MQYNNFSDRMEAKKEKLKKELMDGLGMTPAQIDALLAGIFRMGVDATGEIIEGEPDAGTKRHSD